MTNINLEGEIVFVTGASRGIGSAIAQTLGQSGATIAGTATTEEGADRITELFKQEGIQGAGYKLNVSSLEECQQTLSEVERLHGAISVLVNNAGITRDNLLMRMKEEEWDDMMNTNLKSVYRLSKLVCRNMMKARSGKIINLTSVVGFLGNAGQSNYAAAKAGVIGFSKSLAREVASRGITVNVVAPGFIQTDMTDELTEDQKAATLANVPAGRLGQPDEIAAAVCYLASDAAAYVSGETLHVNGAMYMV